MSVAGEIDDVVIILQDGKEHLGRAPIAGIVTREGTGDRRMDGAMTHDEDRHVRGIGIGGCQSLLKPSHRPVGEGVKPRAIRREFERNEMHALANHVPVAELRGGLVQIELVNIGTIGVIKAIGVHATRPMGVVVPVREEERRLREVEGGVIFLHQRLDVGSFPVLGLVARGHHEIERRVGTEGLQGSKRIREPFRVIDVRIAITDVDVRDNREGKEDVILVEHGGRIDGIGFRLRLRTLLTRDRAFFGGRERIFRGGVGSLCHGLGAHLILGRSFFRFRRGR